MSLYPPTTRLVAELNPEQRAAVLHRGGPVLVLAGAGTGKTRVITVRIAHLVAHDGRDPAGILALTFTNKAAQEMAERVGHFLGRDAAAQMTIGTFHALGLQILERDARRLGFSRGVSLLDAADQASAVRHCLKALHIDPKRHDPAAFLMEISNFRNAGVPPADLLANPHDRLYGRVYQAYLEWLAAYQAMDFDDLILRPNQLFREHPEVLTRWRDRFHTILVDEYQDTNLAQLELIRHLSALHRDLCVVGDDDQSIYGWRGADVRNILEFEKYFPDATAIALTQNYRSTGHILAAANAVIGKNQKRREKSLWTDVGDGEAVQIVTCKDPHVEAAFVAGEITRLVAAEGRPLSDFGVLFRTSAQAKRIEQALHASGLAYRLSGAYAFFERKEVKDLLSYLRLALNPGDETHLLRVINFPQRGLGPSAIERLHAARDAHGDGLLGAIARAPSLPGLSAAQRHALAELHALLRDAAQQVADKTAIAALMRWFITRLSAREAWIRDATEGPGGEHRWRNIEALLALAERWESRNPGKTLYDWLRVVALDGKSAGDEESAEDAIALMTLHAAKGLEWPVCFVIGCQEGIIPHQRTIEDLDGDVTEERRLFYVGITRARRHCYLTLSKVKLSLHGSEPARPSRFVRDIPPALRVDQERQRGPEPLSRDDTRARFEALRAALAAKN